MNKGETGVRKKREKEGGRKGGREREKRKEKGKEEKYFFPSQRHSLLQKP